MLTDQNLSKFLEYVRLYNKNSLLLRYYDN